MPTRPGAPPGAEEIGFTLRGHAARGVSLKHFRGR
jgi:hypothetical protein